MIDSQVSAQQGMYDPAHEHDACGVGFVAHLKGQKSHAIVEQGLLILKNLDHRGAVGADALQGDGAGILVQSPDQLYREEMAAQGVMWEALAEEVEKKQGKPLDPFDLICHVAFDQPALSRRERAEQVKKRNYFAKYSGAARQVLEALLDKYADTGIEHIEDIKILQLDPFSQIGAPIELVKAFGGKAGYTQAVVELEKSLYA